MSSVFVAAPSARSIEALGDEIAARAASMTAALGHWLELVARFDRCEGWGHYGAVSCAEWLAWRCSLSPVTAREHVRVARRLVELPLIAAALRRGELSFSKVRAIARLEHVSDEGRVLELARHASAAQLERIVRLTRRVTRQEAAAAVEHRFLEVMFDDDGCAVIRARVPAEDGALLLRALGHVDALLDAPDAKERPPSPARRADALAWMADRALAETAATSAARERTAGERCEVLVHVDAHVLTGAGEPAAEDMPDSAESTARERRCGLDDGAPVAAETARRLCCDAGIVPVVRDGDRTLAVGRRTRSIPPAIRRALRVRRPSCAFPGCGRTRWLDAHHVVHWAHGGATDLNNLVHLCRHHHRLVHEGGWRVVTDDDGSCRVYAPNGRQLIEAPPALRGADLDAFDPRSPDALAPLSFGERYDIGLAIDALLAWTHAPPTPPNPCQAEQPLAA